jgi:hypothetical protein
MQKVEPPCKKNFLTDAVDTETPDIHVEREHHDVIPFDRAFQEVDTIIPLPLTSRTIACEAVQIGLGECGQVGRERMGRNGFGGICREMRTRMRTLIGFLGEVVGWIAFGGGGCWHRERGIRVHRMLSSKGIGEMRRRVMLGRRARQVGHIVGCGRGRRGSVFELGRGEIAIAELECEM